MPPPGSFFPNGQTVVTCTAVDHCGNTNNCTFIVTVTGEVSTTCCDGCAPDGNGQYPASYTVAVHPGFNYLANQLCRGISNSLAEVLSDVPIPPDTTVTKWNKPTQNFTTTLIYDGAEWLNGETGAPSTTTLPPGEGFILFNPGEAYQLTFKGCEPACPPPCAPTSTVCFVGRIGSGAPTYYSNLFSCPPVCGTRVSIFNNGNFDDYDFVNGVWSPSEPVLGVGRSALVSVVENIRCQPCSAPTLLICASNKTVKCGSAWAFDPPTAGSPCCGTNVTILVLSTETNGTCPQVVTRT